MQLGAEFLATALQSALLNVVLKVVREVVYFALKQLHLVHQLVEFHLVFHNKLLLHVQVGWHPPWNPDSHPEVTLCNQVVNTLDSHQEPEDCIVVLKCLSIKDDLKGPIATEVDGDVVKTVDGVEAVLFWIVSELDAEFALQILPRELLLCNVFDAFVEVAVEEDKVVDAEPLVKLIE